MFGPYFGYQPGFQASLHCPCFGSVSIWQFFQLPISGAVFLLTHGPGVLYYHYIMLQSGAPLNEIAKLVNITPITMVYGTKLTIVTGDYKPTNITGEPHVVYLYM